jgi:hypothetical protein
MTDGQRRTPGLRREENLSVSSAPGQHLVVYHAEPGSPADHAVALLGSYTAAQATDPAAVSGFRHP